MTDEVKNSMILCSGLDPVEQEKVERLDGPISEKFTRAGIAVRTCQGRVHADGRVLDFCGPAGTAASVPASKFVAATDADAVGMIVPQSCRTNG